MSSTKGLIDPSAFHPTSAQLKRGADAAEGLVRRAGHALGDLGERVAEHAATINGRWAGLAGCYQAPEGERVLGLVGPAAAAAEEVRGALVGVKVALEIYADALWGVAVKLAALEDEAQAFRTSEEVLHGVADTSPEAWTAANGVFAAGHGDLRGGMASLDRLASGTVPWWQDQAMVAKNDDFWARLYQCQQDIEQAAWVCSTMICQVAAPQAAAQAFTSGVDTTEQIAAFDAAQGWGRPRDRGLLPGEQAWTDLNDAALAPTAALAFGWDTTSWDGYARTWGNGADAEQARREVRTQTWNGMTDVVAAFAVGAFARNPTTRQMLDDRYGQGWTDQRRQIVSDTALSLIAYDPTRPEDPWHTYRDAPYGAATTLAVNAAGLVAGPKALGALGKTAAGGRAGLTAARTAESLPTKAAHAAETAADGRAAATAALDRAARTDPPPITHHPNLPKVSDTIRKPGDTTPGQSWLYQEPPHEAPPVQRPHTPTGEPAPPGAEHSRTPPSRPTGSAEPHTTAPGRAADAVTTQPITGLPRPHAGSSGLPHDAPTGRTGTAGSPTEATRTTPGHPTGVEGAGGASTRGASHASPQSDGPTRLWDTSDPVARTIPSSDPRAPRYSDADVQRIWDDAPVDEHGQRVDHRDGIPLARERADGQRGWNMVWDPAADNGAGGWLAEHPGAPRGILGDDGWAPGDIHPTRTGNTNWYDTDPVPQALEDLAARRLDLLPAKDAANAALAPAVDHTNAVLTRIDPDMKPLTPDDFYPKKKLDSTVMQLEEQFGDNFDALEAIRETKKTASDRLEAYNNANLAGERFGEKFGDLVREAENGTPLYSGRGSRTVDQAYVSTDGRELVITECKAPHSKLGYVTLPGGTRVQQGSAAYLDYILRTDTRLHAQLRAHGLVDDLISGRITVRYQEARALPDGRGTTTTFDTTKLDTQALFREIFEP